jgi:CPA2 family monovalent cation:H+ antiporter-2
LVGVPMRRVIRIVQEQRDARYKLLRGYFHGADDDSDEELAQEQLSSITLPAGADAIGRRVSEVTKSLAQARIIKLRHRSGINIDPLIDPLLSDGDTLVLSGTCEALALAEDVLLRG